MNSHRAHLRVLCSVAILALLASCDRGGGGGTPTEPDPPGPNPSSSEITEEERSASLAAVMAKAQELGAQELPRDELNTRLAAWIAAQPEFEAAGVEELSSVWAIYRDGRALVIANNRDPLPEGQGDPVPSSTELVERLPGLLSAAVEPTELPVPKQVRLLHSLGPGFAGQAVIDDMKSWFEDAGYTVVAGAEGDARVETLKKVSDDAFFYFNTHGAKLHTRGGEEVYSVGTSSIRTEVKDRIKDFAEDLDAGRLVYFSAPNGLKTPDGEDVWDVRYGITHHFVRKYMNFGENSVVFFNVCGSTYQSPTVAAFIAAVHEKNAGVYLGWSFTVNAEPAYRAARYFVDRMLGANGFEEEDPHQRPFGWNAVVEDMRSQGLTKDPFSGAELTVSVGPQTGSGVGAFAPSIRNLVVDEWNDELIIGGAFGDHDRSEGIVTIDDGSGRQELTLVDWTPIEIRVELPPSGAGSIGDVRVTVRGHDSNPRRLVAWRGTLLYTLDDLGSLSHRLELDLDVRLDAETFRTKPGEDPIKLPYPAFVGSNRRTKARYEFGGSYVSKSGSCTTTHSYSGSGTLSYPAAPDPSGYAPAVAVDFENQVMEVRLPALVKYTHTRTADCGDGETDTFTREARVPKELFGPTDSFTAHLDALMNVLPGERRATVHSGVGDGDAVAELRWGPIAILPGYDPDQPR
jgi:hypothetical protein